MHRVTRLVLALALCASALTTQHAARGEWYESYEDALRAIESGHPRKAVDLLGSALARRPQPGYVRTYGNHHIRYAPQFWLGVAYHDLGDCERAIASFDRAEADRETEGAPVLAARLRALRGACERLVAPPPLDPRRLERGLRAFLAGDLTAAVQIFDELASRAPDSAMPHLLLGTALHGQWAAAGEVEPELLERARGALARAAAIDPGIAPDPALCSPELVALYRSLR